MVQPSKPTLLCIASFFKGNEFIRECKQQGANVLLLTKEKLLSFDWARDSLDELLAVAHPTLDSYLAAASYLSQRWRITKVIALEEFDVVTAAHIREHLCIPGMNVTSARGFQDKLTMRVRAQSSGMPQPQFVSLTNYEMVDEFLRQITGPWMLKPRTGSSSMGIKQCREPEEVWRSIAELNGRETFEETASFHLLEQFVPGDVYHVDSLVDKNEIVFASVDHYCATPFEISQHGGVSISHTVKRVSYEEQALLTLNRRVLHSFGFEQGVTHAEFIRPRNIHAQFIQRKGSICAANPSRTPGSFDEFLFLEVAARVGGAYTAETIEAATSINLWREWARTETSSRYALPPHRTDYGGITVSLARQEHPATDNYVEPEIVYRISKPWHVGLVVSSTNYDRVIELLSSYKDRFNKDFTAVAPPEEKPSQYL